MNITNDAYILACKQAGLSDAITAARLGLSVEEVQAAWERLMQRADTIRSSGYADLVQQYTILAHQYQLLGETLKVIAFALDDHASPEEILKVLPPQDDPEETVKGLLSAFIVLRKFQPVDPEKALAATVSGN